MVIASKCWTPQESTHGGRDPRLSCQLEQPPQGCGGVPTAGGFQDAIRCWITSSRLPFPWKVRPDDLSRSLPTWAVPILRSIRTGEAGSLHPTTAASPRPGLLCLLLEQTLAWSQQEVGEKPGDFTHQKSCGGREGAFVTTEAQSWPENLFSAQSSDAARAAVLHLPPCNRTAEPKQQRALARGKALASTRRQSSRYSAGQPARR